MNKEITKFVLMLVGFLGVSLGIVHLCEESVEYPVKNEYIEYREERKEEDNSYSPIWIPIQMGNQIIILPF